MLNVQALPLLLAILFLILPFFAWLGVKFNLKSIKDSKKHLVGTLLIAPVIITVEYLASKLLGRDFILRNSLRESMIVYVGLSLALWLWVRVFIHVKSLQNQH